MRRLRLLFSMAVVSAFAVCALAQQPNLDRGFSADKLYDLLGLDSVNDFNGNVIVKIPIGQPYKSNGNLAYQLALHYNSSVWDYVWGVDGTVLSALPARRSNAGMGWLLTFGMIAPPTAPGDPENDPNSDSTTNWAYVSADGATHNFTPGGASDPTRSYTKDGSYLRQTRVDDTLRYVDFPDGSRQTFNRYQAVTNGPWFVSALGTKWRLTQTRDSFGNVLNFSYASAAATSSDPQYKEIWTGTDGSRSFSVYFTPESLNVFPMLLHHVVLGAFSGAQARYDFAYLSETFAVTGAGDNTVSTRLAPVLTSITLPDTTSYVMLNGDGSPAYDAGATGTPGGLMRLTLPTKGAVSWTYTGFDDRGGWVLPKSEAQQPTPPQVETRTLSGPGVASGTWTYHRLASNGGLGCSCQTLMCPASNRQLTTWVAQPDGTTKIAYFSIYPKAPRCPDPAWSSDDYGLPFIPNVQAGNGFLSTELRSAPIDSLLGTYSGLGALPNPPAADPLWSREYVRFERDGVGKPDVTNVRRNYSRTEFAGDTQCPGCFRETSLSGYDGFGHFRQSVTDSNIAGTPNRTTFTNYPGALDSNGDWLLTTFTESCVADEATVRTTTLGSCAELPGEATTKFDFVRSNGSLRARRVLRGASAAPTTSDLLALISYDLVGNPTKERFYGGDSPAQQLPTSGDLFAPSGDPEYEISHALTYDANGTAVARKTAYRNIKGASSYASSVNFNATAEDVELDTGTGLVKKSRDGGGFETTFVYDALSRLTTVTPPSGLAGTSVAYTAASLFGSTLTPATATVTTASATAGTISKSYEYDALGRLLHDKTLMPDGTLGQTQTLYNASAQVASVSTRQSASSFVASDKTSYLYDATGNPKTVTAPDGTTTFVTRYAAGQTDTVVSTSPSIAKSEKYDGLGRLRSVTENSSGTSATRIVGDPVTTTYGYDYADRLISVTTTAGTQPRSFFYDPRGLLTTETSPEAGTTTYDHFDARGRALHRLAGAAGGVFDLNFAFDSAERLIHVTDSGSTNRPLKHYAYSDSGSTAGKIAGTTRYNHLAGPGDVVVSETYGYGGACCPAGALASKTTAVTLNGSAFQSFSQSYAYDDLAEAKSVSYPTCVSVACSVTGGVTTLDRIFTNGRLTGVGAGAAYGSITYHPNGAINQVLHPGSVTDTYQRDDHSMARPKRVTFGGYTQGCPTSVAVTPEVTSMCVGAQKTAAATAIAGAGYAWSIQGGSFVGASNAQTITFTSASAGTVTLQATVTPPGCTPLTAQASVTVVASATIQAGSPADPAPIAPGGTAHLTVTASGSNLHYQWHAGAYPNGPVVGFDAPGFDTPALSSSANYWVHVTSDCGAADSRTATVTVLPAPASVVATTGTPTTKITITWAAVSNAGDYMVRCAKNVNGPFNDVGTTSATSIDYNVTPGATPEAYVCRVWSRSGGQESPAVSPIDFAVTGTALFSNEPIARFSTAAGAAHIVELRNAVDALRAAVNLPKLWQGASPPSGIVFAAPITDLFTPLNQARAVFGLPAFAYSGGVPTPAGGVTIRSEHIQEVRNALR